MTVPTTRTLPTDLGRALGFRTSRPRRRKLNALQRALVLLQVRHAAWRMRLDLASMPGFVLTDIGIRDIDNAVYLATRLALRRAVAARLGHHRSRKPGGWPWSS
jgi:hypothetical protein